MLLNARQKWLGALIAPSFVASSAVAEPLSKINLRPGATELSQDIYDLHMLILWICVAIGVAVFSVMIYSMIAHRKSLGREPATFHENTKLELLWTLIPILILVAMAVPATGTLIEINSPEDADMDVVVTGYQWKWQYEYPGTGVSFFSVLRTPSDEIYNREAKGEHYLLEVDEPLVIPTGKKVRFLITAKDVIHSWWVPDFGVKRDAVPGYVSELWTRVDEPGVYRGQCAELCGKDHGFMPVVVVAKEPAEFDAWLAERQEAAAREAELASKDWTLDELMARGEQVYARNCAACHQANGAGAPPAFPPLKDSPIALGDPQRHIEVVYDGVPGTYMAAYGEQLSEVDLAAVITYERNAWGNNVGDQVNPIDIVEFAKSN